MSTFNKYVPASRTTFLRYPHQYHVYGLVNCDWSNQWLVIVEGNNHVTKWGREATRRMYQCAIASEQFRESGRSVVRNKQSEETARETKSGEGERERKIENEQAVRRSRCTEASTSGQGHRAEGWGLDRAWNNVHGTAVSQSAAMEQTKTPASRLLSTSCIENKDDLEEVT